MWREEIYRGLLANDIIGFHTTAYCRNFLHCCRELLELEVDYERGAVLHEGRETWVRAYPLGIDAGRLDRAAGSPRSPSTSASCCGAGATTYPARRSRRPVEERAPRLHLVRRLPPAAPGVPRAGTFIAHLQPSRQDVPEYAEYLERIEALVAVVNHRHGTTHWMPIDLRIYENFPEAVARYKHFDLLMVNSIFDGMNLVAKEAPAVTPETGS